MSGFEYFMDEPHTAWTANPRPDRRGYFQKNLADGDQKRPFAIIARQPEGAVNHPHLHTEGQFQVLLEGAMSFPGKRLAPVAVHYSDANVPYGPFVGEGGLKLAVLRRGRQGDIYYMQDAEGRRRRDPGGREFYGHGGLTDLKETHGAKRTALFGDGAEGPRAEIWRYGGAQTLERTPAPFGRFHILLEGLVRAGDLPLEPYSVFFECGDDWSTTLTAGEGGATLVSLTFGTA